MHELLFKNQQLTDQQFDAGELFKDGAISHSLFTAHDAKPFEMTPSELYAEIKLLAKSRYSYTAPVRDWVRHLLYSLEFLNGNM